MINHWKTNRFLAIFLAACLLFAGVFAFGAKNVFAEPADGSDPAATEEAVTEEEPATSEDTAAQSADRPGIVVSGDSDDEDGNIMDSLLSADRQWLSVFGKIVSRLAIVLGILIVAVVAMTIYIMVTQTTRLSRQNAQMSRRPARSVVPNAAAAGEAPVHQVTQFGDTLRIRRTVAPGNANPNAARPVNRTGAANMARPAAPQRPSRPVQSAQPGVRRPAAQQPIRQPQRPAPNGQRPVQRPAAPPIRQPQRPAQPAPNNGQRPMQRPAQPASNGQRPVQRPAQPVPNNGQRPMQRPAQPAPNNGQRPMQRPAQRPVQPTRSDPNAEN